MCHLTPEPFHGDWYHTQSEERYLDHILQNGWDTSVYINSRYGQGIYFAKGKWHDDAKYALKVQFELNPNEVLFSFDGGNSKSHLNRYVQNHCSVGTNSGPANSSQNVSIQRFFLDHGIRAIHFYESDNVEVVVIYDPNVIRNMQKVDATTVKPCASNNLLSSLEAILNKKKENK